MSVFSGLPPADETSSEAASDYGPIGGVRGSAIAAVAWVPYGMTAGGERHGAGRWDAYVEVPAFSVSDSSPSDIRIVDIEDGTSNSVLLCEKAGGPKAYVLRHLLNSAEELAGIGNGTLDPQLPTSASAVRGTSGWGNSTWGDHWIKGVQFDGYDNPAQEGGLCLINCSNRAAAGWYAFHPGGAHVLLCDGTVRFVSENISVSVFAALSTVAKNEALSSF
jgi:hypothetical protein